MRGRGRWAAGAIAALALVGADAAAASSLVYIKDGNVQLSGADGSNPRAITTNGDWQWPSQADDGTIVAVHREANDRNTVGRLYRFNRSGGQVGAPVATGLSNSSTFNAPIAAQVSPNGQLVAYHYFYGALHGDSPAIAFAPLDRDSDYSELGQITGYLNPSWYDDAHVVAFGSTVTQDTLIKSPGSNSSQAWFQDDSVKLVAGEIDKPMDRFAALTSGGTQIIAYQMNGAPPAAPTPKCQLTANSGESFNNPSWSPDGRQLAFEASGGIYVWNLASLDDCAAGTTALVVPGGKDPDWGPADAGDTTNPVAAATVAKAKLRRALRKGLKVKVKTNEAGAVLIKAGKYATGKRTLPAAGTYAVKVKFNKKAKRKLARKRRVKLTLLIGVADKAGNVAVVRKKLTLKR